MSIFSLKYVNDDSFKCCISPRIVALLKFKSCGGIIKIDEFLAFKAIDLNQLEILWLLLIYTGPKDDNYYKFFTDKLKSYRLRDAETIEPFFEDTLFLLNKVILARRSHLKKEINHIYEIVKEDIILSNSGVFYRLSPFTSSLYIGLAGPFLRILILDVIFKLNGRLVLSFFKDQNKRYFNSTKGNWWRYDRHLCNPINELKTITYYKKNKTLEKCQDDTIVSGSSGLYFSRIISAKIFRENHALQELCINDIKALNEPQESSPIHSLILPFVNSVLGCKKFLPESQPISSLIIESHFSRSLFFSFSNNTSTGLDYGDLNNSMASLREFKESLCNQLITNGKNKVLINDLFGYESFINIVVQNKDVRESYILRLLNLESSQSLISSKNDVILNQEYVLKNPDQVIKSKWDWRTHDEIHELQLNILGNKKTEKSDHYTYIVRTYNKWMFKEFSLNGFEEVLLHFQRPRKAEEIYEALISHIEKNDTKLMNKIKQRLVELIVKSVQENLLLKL